MGNQLKKLAYYGSLLVLSVASVLVTHAALAKPKAAADDPFPDCYFYQLVKTGCSTTGCTPVIYVNPSGVAYTVYDCPDGMGGEFYCFPGSVPLPGPGTTITIVDTWVLNGCTYTRTVHYHVGSPDDGASIDFCAYQSDVSVTQSCPNPPG